MNIFGCTKCGLDLEEYVYDWENDFEVDFHEVYVRYHGKCPNCKTELTMIETYRHAHTEMFEDD